MSIRTSRASARRAAGVAVLVMPFAVVPASAVGRAAAPRDKVDKKIGAYRLSDSPAKHAGAFCTYDAEGQLKAVNVSTQFAAARKEWNPGQSVRWTTQLKLQTSHGWTVVDQETVKTSVRHTVQALHPFTHALGSTKHLVPGNYIVVEQLRWMKNIPGFSSARLPVQGTLTHTFQNYYYGSERTPRSSCNDHRPTVRSHADQNIPAGQTLSIPAPGLLAGASDADGEAIRLHLDGVRLAGGADVPAGSTDQGALTIPTTAGFAGKTIVVTYTAVDEGGVTSTEASMSVHVTAPSGGGGGGTTDPDPVAVNHSYADGLWGSPYSVGADTGLLTNATGAGLSVVYLGNPNFDTNAAGLYVYGDGSFTLNPPQATDSQTLSFQFAVKDKNGKQSPPATASIAVGHHPPIGAADTTYTIKGDGASNHKLLCDATGTNPAYAAPVVQNDTFYGGQTKKALLVSTPATAGWNFSWDNSYGGNVGNGCYSIGPVTVAQNTDFTFVYRPVDSLSQGNNVSVTVHVLH